MVSITDAPLGRRLTFDPLPPFTTPEEILADCLPLLDPPSLLSVTAAAERYMRVEVQGSWQAFDRDTTPYMVEPTDTIRSRLYKSEVFVGPSQSGKTKALEAALVHAITCDQMPVLLVHMTRPDRDKWVDAKLDPMIVHSPEVSDRIGKGRDDSTFSRKRFKGMRVELAYPTPTNLSGGTYGLVLMTDLDHMPIVLGPKDSPEGSPYGMARQRPKTYLSRGCVFAESTPAHPVSDRAWVRPKDQPHAFPPVRAGIVPIYNEGTRGRWYWECRDCGDLYQPCFENLHYDESLAPGEAGKSAVMACPHCGGVVDHRHKMEFNRSALRGKGGWFHETVSGGIAPLGDADVRPSDIASHSLDGAAATFANWRDIVSRFEIGKRRAEELNDESELSSVNYTDIGRPHRALRLDDESNLNLEFLKSAAPDTARKTVPVWARFITVTVDVQGTYFPVQITAWGIDGTAQIIDRFDLSQPPGSSEDAPRRLDPAKVDSDWDVLTQLEEQVWPVEGADYGLKPLALAVDFQGAPGVSDNAEAFWRKRNRAGKRGLWFLSRGHGGFKQPRRVWYEAPERGSKGKKARSIMLLNIAVDRLKDTVTNNFAKGSGLPGAFLVGGWMDDDQINEIIAEERHGTGWEKKPGQVRNETLDLSVVARALVEHKGIMRLDPENLQDWALGGISNSNAVRLDAAPVTQEKEEPKSIPSNGGMIGYLSRR